MIKPYLKVFRIAGFLILLLWSAALPLYADDASKVYQAGLADYQQGLWDECVSEMNLAIGTRPNYWKAFKYLGLAYQQEGKYPQAIDAIKESLRFNPSNKNLQKTLVQLETEAKPTPVATAVLAAPVGNADKDKPGKWIVQIAGGIDVPVSSGASSQLNFGFSGEAMVGYAFTPQLTLGLESGYESITSNPVNIFTVSGSGIIGYGSFIPPPLTHIPLELVGQFNSGDEDSPVRHYLFLGIGVAFDSLSGTGSVKPNGGTISTFSYTTPSWTNLEIDPGMGASLALGRSVYLFVQIKVEMDFGPNKSTSASPAAIEFTDSPIILVPVQAGLSFGF